MSQLAAEIPVNPTEPQRSAFRRFVLVSMVLVLLVDQVPGMGLGIMPGLSAKNLYLYAIVMMIAVRAAMKPEGIAFADLDVHIPFLLLIAYALLTVALASIVDPSYRITRGVITLKNQVVDLYLFMIIFRYGLDSRTDVVRILKVIIVIMFVLSFLTLLDFLNIPDLGIVGTHRGRIEGPFGAANQYGALLAFLLPVSIGLQASETSSGARLFWRIGMLVFAVLLVATGSRGAYLSVVVGSLLSVFYLRSYLDLRQVMRFALLSFVVIVFLLVAFAIFNFDFLVERFEKTTSGNVYTASSGRVSIWTATLLVMAEWPMSFVTGYGWNAYEASGIWKAAHNEYLDRYYELGIPGLLLYVGLIYAVVSRVKRFLGRSPDRDTCRMMIGYVFGMIIISVNIFFVAIPDPWTIIWIVTGCIMAIQAFDAQYEGSVR